MQNRERSEEQVRKQVMIAAATARLEAEKEAMRAAFDLQVKVYAKESDRDAENAKTVSLKTRDEGGDQRKAFDTRYHCAAMAGGPDAKRYNDAQQFMVMIVRETNDLAKARTNRSYLDTGNGRDRGAVRPAVRGARDLRGDLYADGAREVISNRTNKYSATQRMLDGSTGVILDECRASGTRIGFAKGEVAKATIELAATATTTVLSALAPVPDGQQAIAGAGKLSKEGAARAGEITKGVAALLARDDRAGRGSRRLSQQRQLFGRGLEDRQRHRDGRRPDRRRRYGRQQSGPRHHQFGRGGDAAASIGPHIVRWMKTTDPFPWGKVVDEFGAALESGLNAAGDKANSDVGAKLGIAAPTLGGFKVLAKALETRAQSDRKG
ncbi:hypothetical protein AB5I41_09210 [Sphingomonas sp. MMS24-JH45]